MLLIVFIFGSLTFPEPLNKKFVYLAYVCPVSPYPMLVLLNPILLLLTKLLEIDDIFLLFYGEIDTFLSTLFTPKFLIFYAGKLMFLFVLLSNVVILFV